VNKQKTRQTAPTPCIPQIEVRLKRRRVQIACDAPQLSSDGGALLLRQQDEKAGLTAGFASLLSDNRVASRTQHSRLEQMRQRIYQIALGYEDCNDGDWLRNDPMLRLACDAEQTLLSSQPTLSRFENAATGSELNRLWRAFEQQYVDALDRNETLVVLDIDSTDDPTHGNQQLSFFHGYYDQHMFHPLLVFDAHSGQLITGLLRPGKAHAAKGATTILTRLIRSIRKHCPNAAIVVRGDSAFALPKLMARLEELNTELGDIDYVLGIAKNARLLALAKPLSVSAKEQFDERGQFVRRFTWLSYAAKSWPAKRHVVAKLEHSSRGPNPRFVVTTLHEFPPDMIYDIAYCPRGQAENFIKDLKNAIGADRLSCHRFLANAFRLFLHAVAYRLMHALRDTLARVAPPTLHVSSDRVRLGVAQMDTIRRRLLKVAALVVSSARRVLIRLPRAFPLAHVFVAASRHLGVT